MKSLILSILALASTSIAHYTFPELVVGGKGTGNWQYVRQTANYQSNGTLTPSSHVHDTFHHTNNDTPGPVTDVSSTAIRCYQLAPGTSAKTYTVNAGDTVAFTAASSVSHPGPMQFYMAKVPSGQTAETWDGSGNAWFKIYQEEAITTSSSISWASMGKTQVPVTLPKSLPSGQYLLRAEHIALHSAGSSGGAQVSSYFSCGLKTVYAAATVKSLNCVRCTRLTGLFSSISPVLRLRSRMVAVAAQAP